MGKRAIRKPGPHLGISMGEQPESKYVANPFCDYCRNRGWYIKNTHGNEYQQGFPDKRFMHPNYPPRWVEFKLIKTRSTGIGVLKYTDAQIKEFPLWHRYGEHIVVISAFNLINNEVLLRQAYKKLIDPEPNVMLAMDKHLQRRTFVI